MVGNPVGRPAGVGTALALLVAIVVASIGALVATQWWPDTGSRLATKSAAVITRLSAGTTATTTGVRVDVATLTPRPAVAPAWSGLVTAVLAAPGATITQGEPIVEIDGRLVRAAITQKPFYRALSLGDAGADVTALRSLLRRAGYPVASVGPVDATVAAAARDWIGVADKTGPVFTPTEVVWVAHRGETVSSISLSVGEMAPAQGSPIVSFQPRVQSASMDAGAVPSGAKNASVGIGNQDYAVAGGGHLRLTAVSRDRLAHEVLTRAAPLSESDPSVQTGAHVMHTTISATLKVEWPSPVFDIPTSSIVTRSDGSLCVVVKASNGLVGRTVSVFGSDTGAGISEAANLERGLALVVNPLESSSAASCNSGSRS